MKMLLLSTTLVISSVCFADSSSSFLADDVFDVTCELNCGIRVDGWKQIDYDGKDKVSFRGIKKANVARQLKCKLETMDNGEFYLNRQKEGAEVETYVKGSHCSYFPHRWNSKPSCS